MAAGPAARLASALALVAAAGASALDAVGMPPDCLLLQLLAQSLRRLSQQLRRCHGFVSLSEH